jgi:L-lactate dehydrogenase complex protein LldG
VSSQAIETFIRAATEASAEVVVLDRLQQALIWTVELASRYDPGLLAAPGWDAAHGETLERACEERGVTLLGEGLRDHAERINVGLTPASRGIAETGTIVVESTDEQVRLATMLAKVHVAILAADRIVPDLEAIQQQLAERMARAPGYLALITGPSRTADIERVLTIGVHGPAELKILVVTEEQGGAP